MIRTILRRAALGGTTIAAVAMSAIAFAQEAAPDAAPGPILDRGDTAWMLTATALVLMMTIPGLALFYGGMVRKMNVLSMTMQCFATCCLASIIWMVVGYSLAFTEGNDFFGGFSRFLLSGLEVGGAHGLLRIDDALQLAEQELAIARLALKHVAARAQPRAAPLQRLAHEVQQRVIPAGLAAGEEDRHVRRGVLEDRAHQAQRVGHVAGPVVRVS